jgi:uncharacterized repeat protein (TIGR03803 family)
MRPTLWALITKVRWVILTSALACFTHTVAAQTYNVFTSWQGNDGYLIRAGVLIDKDGNLYSTAEDGGTGGAGTVFKLDSEGSVTGHITSLLVSQCDCNRLRLLRIGREQTIC